MKRIINVPPRGIGKITLLKIVEGKEKELPAGMKIKIKVLAELICELVKYKGKIKWDRSKPDGQLRRRLDVGRAQKEFGFKAGTDFKKRLKQTIDWYIRMQKT